MNLPLSYWGTMAFVLGAVIGSFLNVVIWRLPRGESLSHPGSHCPRCGHSLSAWENIPVLSYLVLRGRCRACKEPISVRYPVVEALTGFLFFVFVLRFGPTIQAAAYCLFGAALIAAFFIDLDHFIIPDELNISAWGVGVALDLWLAHTGDPAHRLIWGWLPRSIAAGGVCALLFVAIQLIGQVLFRRDAMGDGDVKLARAIGAMLPLPQALVSFFLAVAAGALIGGTLLLLHGEKEQEEDPSAGEGEAEPARTSVSAILMYGFLYAACLDVALHLASLVRLPVALRWTRNLFGSTDEGADEEFVAGPTHIPFGPYMVVGALAAVFVAEPLIRWYLHWARLE
ncbi:MAG: prepilin peptidase [Chthonomonadales bacterium]